MSKKPRPIRVRLVKGGSVTRPPRTEYLTPRLNADDLPDAIGFVHSFARDDDEWDDPEEIPSGKRIK